MQKRKVFDTKQQRKVEAEDDYPKQKIYKPNLQSKKKPTQRDDQPITTQKANKWKNKSEQFRAAMRAARGPAGTAQE